jgi:hypothetical protein
MSRVIPVWFRWLTALAIVWFVAGASSAAAGTIVDPCTVNPGPFGGLTSPKCVVGTVGQSSTDYGISRAGFDYGQTGISEIWDMSSAPQGANAVVASIVIGAVTASPTWDVDTAYATLRLTGLVDIDDPDAYLSLTLIGMIGGDTLSVSETLTRANCGQQCNLASFPDAGTGGLVDTGDMSEYLMISSKGRVYYNANDPDPFTAVPEPTALLVVAIGFLFLVSLVRCRQPA